MSHNFLLQENKTSNTTKSINTCMSIFQSFFGRLVELGKVQNSKCSRGIQVRCRTTTGEEMPVLGLSSLPSWGSLVSVGLLMVFSYVIIKLRLAYLDYLRWAPFFTGLPMDPYPSKLLGHLLMVFIQFFCSTCIDNE